MSTKDEQLTAWPLIGRIGFRFLFVFLVLYIAPWTWVSQVPYLGGFLGFVSAWHHQCLQFLTEQSKALLGIDAVVNRQGNGSGDTVDNWVSYGVLLAVAALATAVWSVLDSQRAEYIQLNKYLTVLVRYKLAITMFVYGLIKVFPLQMPFPSLSQLVTPFGDFSMMRLSWLFIGVSPAYQVVSGLMEVLSGILLLFRRTTLLGIAVIIVVLVNVVLFNYAYDIIVKLYSANLLLMGLYLFVQRYREFSDFFLYRQKGGFVTLPVFLNGSWHKTAAIVAKGLVIVAFLVLPFHSSYQRYDDGKYKYSLNDETPIAEGLFEIERFVLGGDTLAQHPTDSVRWHNLVLEKWAGGSIGYGLKDLGTLRYGRDYFDYYPDTVNHLIAVKFRKDSVRNTTFEYQVLDSNRITLKGKLQEDSVFVELVRNPNVPEILAERRFNWISNYTR